MTITADGCHALRLGRNRASCNDGIDVQRIEVAGKLSEACGTGQFKNTFRHFKQSLDSRDFYFNRDSKSILKAGRCVKSDKLLTPFVEDWQCPEIIVGVRLTLAEALRLANQPTALNESRKIIHLACGFTPLHLSTFLKAYGRLCFPGTAIEVETGLFDDLIGNVSRIQPASEAAVVMEWSDLDPRLGLRHSGGCGHGLFADVERQAAVNLSRFSAAIRQIAQRSIVALASPTLPLPPIGFTGPAQDSAFERGLRTLVNSTFDELCQIPNVRILSDRELGESSPLSSRLDLSLWLSAGFPYSLCHTDAVAQLLVEVLFPPEPRKGLITDLDDTLWSGILGEVGVENVGWTLETHAQQHGLYQQYLGALAERGTLLAIASKNDGTLVERALARTDLLCPKSAFFPIECNWGAKSVSIHRILQAWNIGPKGVVFVDDSPTELAEVAANFPEMTCLQFPRKNPAELWKLLQGLRKLFGRRVIEEEDRIRATSIRSAYIAREGGSSLASDDFLRQLQGQVLLDFSKNAKNTRALELVNKTNQFNLNGHRWTESDWLRLLHAPETFLITVSYSDKFGSLGRVAVLAGTVASRTLHIETWVMSCRAFSRRIEHEVLSHLIGIWSAEQIKLDFLPTERNGPMREFIQSIVGPPSETSPVCFSAHQFKSNCLPLVHCVTSVSANDQNTSLLLNSSEVN